LNDFRQNLDFWPIEFSTLERMKKIEPRFAAQSLLSAGLVSTRIGMSPHLVAHLAQRLELPVTRLNDVAYIDERDLIYLQKWMEKTDAAKRAELGAGAMPVQRRLKTASIQQTSILGPIAPEQNNKESGR